MSTLTWDDAGKRLFESGVDKVALFLQSVAGAYPAGVAWNGVTAVTESPSGAEPSPLYADNIKYLNLMSVEEFGGTIEAYTYPDEFAECDGSAEPTPGIMIGQQERKTFGLCYRTKLGNDTNGQDHGYKLHLIYGALAAPSEKAYSTVNDSPEAVSFSWEFTTTPVAVTGMKPSSYIVIDSTKVNSAKLALLEAQLYGTDVIVPNMPLPDDVIDLLTV